MSNVILKVEKVNKVFNTKSGDVWVLKNVDLEVNQNDFIILFGPSGCGKSTLLHICMGLEQITSGSVSFLGKDIGSMTDDEQSEFRKNNIGIIYQQSNWILAANVLVNVAFPLMLKGVKKEDAYLKAREMIDLVGMGDWVDYFPSELSSGQQQKIGLARCLVSDPKVIIADEPTGNLDYNSSLDLISLFKNLSKEGVTIIMVTHNTDNLGNANKIFQMFDGHIVNEIETSNHSEKEIQEILRKRVNVTTPITPRHSLKNKVEEPRSTLIERFTGFYSYLGAVLKTLVLILIYVFDLFLFSMFKSKLMPRFLLRIYSLIAQKLYSLSEKIDKKHGNTIKFFDLAGISMTNLLSKRSRSLITVGGIAIGIAFTVLLISLGYGVESLVISRVATLNELNQVDVVPAVSSNIFLTDKSLESIRVFDGVSEVHPIVSVAGVVKFNVSQTEGVVYGVTTNYLENVETNLIAGEYFQDQSEEVRFLDNRLEEESLVQSVSNSQEETGEDLVTVNLSGEPSSEVIVNTALLELLGLSKESAVGESMDLETIVTSNLTESLGQIRSTGREYLIVGVVEEGASPIVYIPINDLEIFGITKFSQLKVVLDDKENISDVRARIEALGFGTASVQDTVVQIEEFFRTIRFVFAVISGVALFVASLGMFNTLTVSLLERTREVGLMKALGMKSKEVRELFLSESVLMGITGGVIGVVAGVALGLLLSIVISIFSMLSGGGFISLTYMPISTIFYILLLSCFIGVITGLYPARRATRISALNALRYE